MIRGCRPSSALSACNDLWEMITAGAVHYNKTRLLSLIRLKALNRTSAAGDRGPLPL